jgi:ribose 5-phosphate isomerase B
MNITNHMNIRIAIGSDHAGFDVKELIKKSLMGVNPIVENIELKDLGPHSDDRVDYPDYAHQVAEHVSSGTTELGVLICGSGNGVCITANKHKGVRAALAWDTELASLAREHNNANIICLPARFVSNEKALEIVKAFLSSKFEGGRHEDRVAKIEN